MIETLFNYGGDSKSSQLSMALFYKDTPGNMDVVDPVADDTDANMGLKARYTFTKQSNTVDMMGPIHSDIFFQDRLIGHVRYINILTWLRGFRFKLLYLVLFSLYSRLFWELRDKRNLKNLQF